MDKTTFRAVVLISTVVTLAPRSVLGQGASSSPRPTAVWHEAVEVEAKLGEPSTDPGIVYRAARLELLLGRPKRAAALIHKHRVTNEWDVQWAGIWGEIQYRLGRFDSAAAHFAAAAAVSRKRERGVFAARAGAAFEQAGHRESAHTEYQIASVLLPEVADWISIRLARTLADTVRAFSLLEVVPDPARVLASRAVAELRLAASDTAGATEALMAARLPVRAAALALASGDTTQARTLTYGALGDRDAARVGQAIAFSSRLPPKKQRDFLTLARATQRLHGARSAVRWAAKAVEIGPPNADALLLWADLLSHSGQRVRALRAYANAAELGGSTALTAAFRKGRLELRLGRVSAGIATLERFAQDNPTHPRAPEALYLVAKRRIRANRLDEGYRLYAAISERWPRSTLASRARIDLARHALASADTAAALDWYQLEVTRSGVERNAAQYRMGELLAAAGDSVEARGLWAVLARRDSIGYYGTIARAAAGLPPLTVEQAGQPPLTRSAMEALTTLDVLEDLFFEEEAELLIAFLMEPRPRAANELLDLAEGLIERGRTTEGVRLGWRAAQAYTLNHPRVLRVIFPWPMREVIEAEARKFDVDPYLLAGLIRQESSFKASAVSRAGANGLMQLMPVTGRQVARGLSVRWDRRLLLVADANLHLGVAHFAALLRHYDGAVAPALAAYNAGGTPVRRWLRRAGAEDPVRFVEAVSYVETRGYLKTVMRNAELYRALYPPVRAEVDDSP
ncbi:MAG: transglycosylase SLT domain-containing protein [Gemmatimonadales bacterium]